MTLLLTRLERLESASPKGCIQFSELWVRPTDQTEKERAEFFCQFSGTSAGHCGAQNRNNQEQRRIDA